MFLTGSGYIFADLLDKLSEKQNLH